MSEVLSRDLLHCWYRYMGLLKKIVLGRCVFLAKAPVLINIAISQQEHQLLLFAALAILSVVLRARSCIRRTEAVVAARAR